jgi:molecular chaperone DnaK (HSP70)
LGANLVSFISNIDVDITEVSQEFEKLHLDLPTKRKRIIIAIDYGTTFSAVAYYVCDDDDFEGSKKAGLNSIQPIIIRDYPGMVSRNSHESEVPTVSIYPNRGTSRYEWGNGVYSAFHNPNRQFPLDTPKLELVKLLLSEKEEAKKEHALLEQKLKKCGVTIVKVISDFLWELWKNAVDRIKLNEGQARFESSSKDLIISVPPSWSANAVRIMQKAAEQAGLPEPEIVAEQEAAALMVLSERSRDDKRHFQVQNTHQR